MAIYTGMNFGVAATSMSLITSIAELGIGIYAASNIATGLNDINETWTGKNFIRDRLMGGSQGAYDTYRGAQSLLNMSIVQVGSDRANYNKSLGNSKDGIVYLRTDIKTGKQYIGQSKSEERYLQRQIEHARANKDAEYIFEEVGRAQPGKQLDILEQKMINKYGGLEKSGGILENKRNQIRMDNWLFNGIN